MKFSNTMDNESGLNTVDRNDLLIQRSQSNWSQQNTNGVDGLILGTYGSCQDLNNHSDHIQNPNIKKVNGVTIKKDSHKCNFCNNTFPTKQALKNHEDTIHSDKKVFCDHCNRSFRSLNYLKNHVDIEHMTDTDIKIPCPKEGCDLLFPSEYRLNRHIRQDHKSEKLYSCKMCDKKFNKSEALNNHLKTKHNFQFGGNGINKRAPKKDQQVFQQGDQNKESENDTIYASSPVSSRMDSITDNILTNSSLDDQQSAGLPGNFDETVPNTSIHPNLNFHNNFNHNSNFTSNKFPQNTSSVLGLSASMNNRKNQSTICNSLSNKSSITSLSNSSSITTINNWKSSKQQISDSSSSSSNNQRVLSQQIDRILIDIISDKRSETLTTARSPLSTSEMAIAICSLEDAKSSSSSSSFNCVDRHKLLNNSSDNTRNLLTSPTLKNSSGSLKRSNSNSQRTNNSSKNLFNNYPQSNTETESHSTESHKSFVLNSSGLQEDMSSDMSSMEGHLKEVLNSSNGTTQNNLLMGNSVLLNELEEANNGNKNDTKYLKNPIKNLDYNCLDEMFDDFNEIIKSEPIIKKENHIVKPNLNNANPNFPSNMMNPINTYPNAPTQLPPNMISPKQYGHPQNVYPYPQSMPITNQYMMSRQQHMMMQQNNHHPMMPQNHPSHHMPFNPHYNMEYAMNKPPQQQFQGHPHHQISQIPASSASSANFPSNNHLQSLNNMHSKFLGGSQYNLEFPHNPRSLTTVPSNNNSMLMNHPHNHNNANTISGRRKYHGNSSNNHLPNNIPPGNQGNRIMMPSQHSHSNKPMQQLYQSSMSSSMLTPPSSSSSSTSSVVVKYDAQGSSSMASNCANNGIHFVDHNPVNSNSSSILPGNVNGVVYRTVSDISPASYGAGVGVEMMPHNRYGGPPTNSVSSINIPGPSTGPPNMPPQSVQSQQPQTVHHHQFTHDPRYKLGMNNPGLNHQNMPVSNCSYNITQMPAGAPNQGSLMIPSQQQQPPPTMYITTPQSSQSTQHFPVQPMSNIPLQQHHHTSVHQYHQRKPPLPNNSNLMPHNTITTPNDHKQPTPNSATNSSSVLDPLLESSIEEDDLLQKVRKKAEHLNPANKMMHLSYSGDSKLKLNNPPHMSSNSSHSTKSTSSLSNTHSVNISMVNHLPNNEDSILHSQQSNESGVAIEVVTNKSHRQPNSLTTIVYQPTREPSEIPAPLPNNTNASNLDKMVPVSTDKTSSSYHRVNSESFTHADSAPKTVTDDDDQCMDVDLLLNNEEQQPSTAASQITYPGESVNMEVDNGSSSKIEMGPNNTSYSSLYSSHQHGSPSNNHTNSPDNLNVLSSNCDTTVVSDILGNDVQNKIPDVANNPGNLTNNTTSNCNDSIAKISQYNIESNNKTDSVVMETADS